MLGLLFGNAMRGTDTVVVHRDSPSTATGKLSVLEHRLDVLEIACAGMWRLLKEQHGYSDEELVAAIHAADAADGKVDGKISQAVPACAGCGRKVLSRSSGKCLWCGALLQQNPLAG